MPRLRETKAQPKERHWGRRTWLRIGASFFVIMITAMAARAVQRYVLDDPRFIMVGSPAEAEDSADFVVQGVAHTSRDRIIHVFADDFGKNIFLIPVAERRRQLLGIDWVREATVARLWPNRVVIRIEERTPVAFVKLAADPVRHRASRPALIDAEGVLLQQPEKGKFSFPVLSGVNERQSEAERKVSVGRMLRLLKELTLLERPVAVTEVDVGARDLRLSMELDHKEVELILGERYFAKKVLTFLHNYPEIHRRTPQYTVFDLRLDNRIIAREAE